MEDLQERLFELALAIRREWWRADRLSHLSLAGSLTDTQRNEATAMLREMAALREQRVQELKALAADAQPMLAAKLRYEAVLLATGDTGSPERLCELAGATAAAAAIDRTDLAINSQDAAILRYLLELHPVMRTLADIEAGTDVSRKTAGDRVDKLITADVLHRPEGDRGGVALTKYGKAIAESLPKAH
jgi:hypothetical protein